MVNREDNYQLRQLQVAVNAVAEELTRRGLTVDYVDVEPYTPTLANYTITSGFIGVNANGVHVPVELTSLDGVGVVIIVDEPTPAGTASPDVKPRVDAVAAGVVDRLVVEYAGP